jgi:hypothetical protein
VTTIGASGGAYAYPANVRRFGNGSVIPTAELKVEDRAAWAQATADSYNRSDGVKPKTAEDVLRFYDESDKTDLRLAQTKEALFSGTLKLVNGSSPEIASHALTQAREARSQHYIYHNGPVVIEAMNVSSAVNAQKSLTGGDLKNLSTYGDYLRNEVAAASKARPDVAFQGAWGSDRVTNDVNEYVGWIMQAMQQASQATAEERSA